MGPRGSPEDPKVTALRASRCLNPHPEQVSDPTFRAEEFFDARDVVQVKYEMIRRVSVEGQAVTLAATADTAPGDQEAPARVSDCFRTRCLASARSCCSPSTG